MNNLIQQLKDNEKPFILMSEKMQDWMLAVEKSEDIEQMVCTANLKIRWFSMSIRISRGNCKNMETTYRLHPNYADEPDLVECEIYTVAAIQGFHTELYDFGEEHELPLALIPNGYTRIGFKFADGTVMGSPIKYSVPGITSHGYYASYEDLKTGQAIEHHAISVLFRRKKQE